MSPTKRRYQTLTQRLDELAKTDPSVRAALQQYDNACAQILERRIHPLPCQDPDCPWHHAVIVKAQEAKQ